MTQQVFKVAKKGESAHSTDPNDFVFHSEYNTFKIIKEATKQVTLLASTADQSFSESHLKGFVPLVTAFAQRDGQSQVFAPNSFDVEAWGAKLGMSGDIKFNYVTSNSSSLVFNFDNDDGSIRIVNIRYFLLEKI